MILPTRARSRNGKQDGMLPTQFRLDYNLFSDYEMFSRIPNLQIEILNRNYLRPNLSYIVLNSIYSVSDYVLKHGLRTPNKSKIFEEFGRCVRQNMLRPYLKIWDWD